MLVFIVCWWFIFFSLLWAPVWAHRGGWCKHYSTPYLSLYAVWRVSLVVLTLQTLSIKSSLLSPTVMCGYRVCFTVALAFSLLSHYSTPLLFLLSHHLADHRLTDVLTCSDSSWFWQFLTGRRVSVFLPQILFRWFCLRSFLWSCCSPFLWSHSLDSSLPFDHSSAPSS